MGYVYSHYLLKYPLLWILFPPWILIAIILNLSKEANAPTRR